MLKLKLNKNSIKQAGDYVFNHISNYFLGNINASNYQIEQDLPVETVSFASYREWDLNQKYSDIYIRDITLIISHLIPVSLIHSLSKIRRNILICFYMDEMEENVPGSRPHIPAENYFSLSLRPKVAYISEQVHRRLNNGVITFVESWKNIVRKLKLLLGFKNDDKIYYLIGNFSSQRYNNENSDQPSKIRGPDSFGLKSLILFHKRI